jgi:hypothetical protein
MNLAWDPAARSADWQSWNDRHLAATIARWRLLLARRRRPEADIAQELAAGEAQRAEAEQALAQLGQLPALAAVASRCGLDGFALEVLGLALAVELDADCAAMLPQGRLTPGLAAALLGAAPSRLLAFAPTAPLLALRLLELEPASPLAGAALRLPPRLRDHLLGLDRVDEEAGFLAPLPVLDLPRPLAACAAQLATRLRAGCPRVAIHGPAAVAEAVAALGAQGAGLRAMRLDVAPLTPGAMALARREAALSGLVYVLPPGAALPDLPVPLLPCGEDAAALPAGVPAIRLPGQGPAARAVLWRAAAPALGAAAARRLARQFDLPAATILRVAADGGEGAIWARARAAAAPPPGLLGERILPRAGWQDLVLPPEPLAALREVAAAAAARDVVERRWGMASSRGQGLAVLLAGPSGTGKTLAAEVLAGALGLDLFRIDLAGVVSKWIGETEKNLAKVFDAAAAGGAVLFFDEADALFGKRSEVQDSHDRHANIEVAYLLQRMEAHRGVSILATNLRANLDQAFLRRLRFAIDLPFPDEAARRAIWARHLPPRAPRAQDLDLDALARLDLPGGAIRNVALNGASLAAAAGVPIGMAQLMAAARREFAKLGRLAKGSAR